MEESDNTSVVPSSNAFQQRQVRVHIENELLDEGGMRRAYKMRIEGENEDMVAKFYISDGSEEVYLQDAKMQATARVYADMYFLYLKCEPPKRVLFLELSAVQLIDRPGKPWCGCEKFLRGTYKKWNGNIGGVDHPHQNTPQAFSHFTYWASSGNVLVCDIQGVETDEGFILTDPQVELVYIM